MFYNISFTSGKTYLSKSLDLGSTSIDEVTFCRQIKGADNAITTVINDSLMTKAGISTTNVELTIYEVTFNTLRLAKNSNIKSVIA